MPAPAPMPWVSRFFVGMGTYRESYFVSDLDGLSTHGLARDWGDYDARYQRYAIFWAHYEGNVYRKIRRFSGLMKSEHGLYDYTRTIMSPAFRTGEFWASHIVGGILDPGAGDGKCRPSCLPIVIPWESDGEPDSAERAANEDRASELRAVIAQVWRDSNWQAYKDSCARFGAVKGDVGLMVVDDEAKRKVYIKVVDPKTIFDAPRDFYGNCKGYTLLERRIDPVESRMLGASVFHEYTEVAERVGDSVQYATYRDGEPYDWTYDPDLGRGNRGDNWTEPYGFVPFLVIQHRNVGLEWGFSEYQPSLSKFMELDDLASKLDDWIRKAVDSPWLFSGCRQPTLDEDGNPIADTGNITIVVPSRADDNPEPGRNFTPVIYASDKDAKGQPLIAPLDVAAASAHILAILKEIERDHPELQADMATASGDASGRALRVARERVEAMVVQRRAAYDDAFVRAHQMAISIGAMKDYPGFEAFTAESYARGELDHSIGDRPVFAVDESDVISEKAQRAAVLKVLVDAGMPILSAMKEAGYSDELIAEIEAAKAEQEAKDRAAQAALVQTNSPANGIPPAGYATNGQPGNGQAVGAGV